MEQALRLAAVFTDHMVLQRCKEIAVFGTGVTGRLVAAEICGKRARATVRDGQFCLRLPPLAPGGPYTLSVSDGETTLQFEDVLIGDVYFAGGQSNMELEIQNADGGRQAYMTADNPQIRFYNTPKVSTMAQVDDAEQNACWRVLAPGACQDVSAVMFFFAVELQPEIGVPIGVIDCYWGGTSAACWMRRDALNRFTVGQEYLARYEDAIRGQSQEQYERDLKAYDDRNMTWWGKANEMKEKDPDITMAQISAVLGDSPWPPPMGPKAFFRPAGLAETMVARVCPYTIKAFTYYQGEEDTSHPEDYRELMSALVLHWRALWHDDQLPFLLCQLPMFIDNNDVDDPHWPIVRKAQADVAKALANTGLVVLIDCGERHNIHPTDKKTVGHRLYLQAMQRVYDELIDGDSPMALCKWQEGDTLFVRLSAPVSLLGESAGLFELAGEDGQYYPAKAQITGDRIALCAEAVPLPQKARYAFVGYGEVSLFGENGLPLAPFVLD